MMTGTTEKYALPLANASDTFDATDINVVTQAVEDTISGLEGAHDEDIENLNTELETTKGAVTEVSDDLAEAQTNLNAGIAAANTQITALQTQLEQLQTDIQQAELNLQTLQTAMSTKADLSNTNIFTKQQKIDTLDNIGLIIKKNNTESPSLNLENANGAIGLVANTVDKNFVISTIDGGYKMLDIRSFSKYKSIEMSKTEDGHNYINVPTKGIISYTNEAIIYSAETRLSDIFVISNLSIKPTLTKASGSHIKLFTLVDNIHLLNIYNTNNTNYIKNFRFIGPSSGVFVGETTENIGPATIIQISIICY